MGTDRVGSVVGWRCCCSRCSSRHGPSRSWLHSESIRNGPEHPCSVTVRPVRNRSKPTPKPGMIPRSRRWSTRCGRRSVRRSETARDLHGSLSIRETPGSSRRSSSARPLRHGPVPGSTLSVASIFDRRSRWSFSRSCCASDRPISRGVLRTASVRLLCLTTSPVAFQLRKRGRLCRDRSSRESSSDRSKSDRRVSRRHRSSHPNGMPASHRPAHRAACAGPRT